MTLKPIKDLDKIPLLALPSVTQEVTESQEEPEESSGEEGKSVEQIDDLITLSGFPNSRWQNLLDIDIIKKRNKPKEKLQVPKAAPFFLPTIPAMDITFDLSSVKKVGDSKMVSLTKWDSLTPFGTLLKKAEEDADLREVFEKLKCMGPSAIDHEISSFVAADDYVTNQLLSKFMKMIKLSLESKLDFELSQAYLGLFLKIHGGAIIENDELLNDLESLKESQKTGWQKLENDLHYNLCVIKALKI